MKWRTTGDVPFHVWRDTLASAHSPLTADLWGSYRAAQPYTRLALAMMKQESKYGTHYRRNTVDNKNVFNLRPRHGKPGYQKFGLWADGVREWKARITDPDYAYVDTQTVLDLVEIFAPKNDDNDPIEYANAVETMILDLPREGGPDMTESVIKAPFRVSIIPAGNPNRPGALLNTNDRDWYITQHTTGNTNVGANAEMHRVFVHQGGGPSRVSFHFTVDGKEIIQLLPVYEIGWHAGDGCDDRGGDIGCFDSVGIELCVNSDGDWMAAKENLSRLYAMLVTKDPRIIGIERGDFSLDRVKTHQQVSDDRKYCPTQLLNEGSMPVIIGRAEVIVNRDIVTPVYAKPSVPDWLANDDGRGIEKIGQAKVYPVRHVYTAIRDTERRQATGLNKALVGPDIKRGEVFEAGRAYRSAGETFILTDYGTRVRAADLIPKVQITTSGVVSVRYELATG